MVAYLPKSIFPTDCDLDTYKRWFNAQMMIQVAGSGIEN